MEFGEIAKALASLFKGRSTLGILLILSFIVIVINHFINIGLVGILSWIVFIVCFVLYVAYNIFNLRRQ